MSRIRDIAPETLTEAQKRVYENLRASPRESLRGPFAAWLESPEFCDRAQRLGAFLRFDAALAKRLIELAVLIVARQWSAQFEWYAHERYAREAGLAAEIIDAIEARRRPRFAAEDERAVYDFATELLDRRAVSDATFAAAERLLGKAGLAELVGVLGYYTLVSMTLNAYQVGLPPGVEPPLAG